MRPELGEFASENSTTPVGQGRNTAFSGASSFESHLETGYLPSTCFLGILGELMILPGTCRS
jgi:hypothetical protein